MEALILAIIIFIFTLFWMLIDLDEDEDAYEPIDRIEDDEKAVVIYKKTKIKRFL